jgi:hypothetical protein
VSPLRGPLAPSAYFFTGKPDQSKESSKFRVDTVHICSGSLPSGNNLIEIKQLCGVANDLPAHPAIRGGKLKNFPPR